MSEDLQTTINEGLKQLHAKADNTSAEYKSAHEALKADIKEFARQAQEAEAKAKGATERLEVIQAELDKVNAKSTSKATHDPKEVLAKLDKSVFGHRGTSTREELNMSTLIAKAQTASQGAFGGVLMNEGVINSIVATYIKDSSPMLREANIVTLPRGTSSMPFARKTINLGAKFAGERQSGGKTNSTYDKVLVVLSRIAADNITTEELMQGQLLISETSLTADLLADISYQIQYEALRGDGLSKPKGVLTEKYLLDTAYESSGQATPVNPAKPTHADLINVKRQFKYAKYRDGGKFYMSYDTFADLFTEKDAENRFIDSTNLVLGGSPVVIFDDMDYGLSPVKLPIVYGDMSKAYTIALTGDYNVIVDRAYDASQGLIQITASSFAGGHTIDEEALRAIKGVQS